MDNIQSALQDVFREVFEEDDLEFRDDLTAADIAQWDSIHHVDMIIAVEQALGVRFATAEVARLKQPGQTAGSIVRMLQEKLAAKQI
jgi:acyl carrier protein